MTRARRIVVGRRARSQKVVIALMAVGGALLAAFSTVSPAAIAATNASGSSTGQRSRTASPATILGSGSTYAANAIQQWQYDGQAQGLNVNYSPQGSPVGLQNFANNTNDFAATEAEYASIVNQQSGASAASRGYQYIPDVGGAIAIMYNIKDKADRPINYLHLSRQTVAKIFMGNITNWDDPQISADNKGLKLPNHPIKVVYRSGESGTTALFYDFVYWTEPGLYKSWAAKNLLPAYNPNASSPIRIITLDNAQFAPLTDGRSSSDLVAQAIKSDQGLWSIGYDEMSYAVTYNVPTAYVQNASGVYQQPYAVNMTAALKSAILHPDLSQDLHLVYSSPDPAAYPISAYSYLVTQCYNSDGKRPTCRGPYRDPGKTETLRRWLRWIACDGQEKMAKIGYTPLPPQLSQFVADAIGRLTNTPREILTPANCANPTFHGSLGPGATNPASDPLAGVAPGGLAPGANNGNNALNGNGPGNGSGTYAGPGTNVRGVGSNASSSDPNARAGVGRKGGLNSINGGSDTWKNSNPAAYTHKARGMNSWAWALLVGALVIPVIAGAIWQRRRRPSAT